MKRGLTWRIIAELYRLYTEGDIKTKDYVVKSPYFKHLESFHYIELARKNRVTITDSYKRYYEQVHLTNYTKYVSFLESNDLLDPHWNFKEEDIQTLILIHDNKKQIVESGQTKNQISSFYFRHEDAKYLRKCQSLSNAILKLTGLDRFPGDEKDQQYIICVPCKRPKAILLCENMDKLRMPDIYQSADIELWYAGGRNIAKLANIRENEVLPFWYCCDWDHDGLSIYHAIKRDYVPRIQMVIPRDWKEAKKALGDHKSLWSKASDYDTMNFLAEERRIIQALVKDNEWVEEESFTFDLQSLC